MFLIQDLYLKSFDILLCSQVIRMPKYKVTIFFILLLEHSVTYLWHMVFLDGFLHMRSECTGAYEVRACVSYDLQDC